MSAVIFDRRDGKIINIYKTFSAANGAFTRMCKKNNCENLECSTRAHYMKTGHLTAMAEVTVYSIFDKRKENPIKIRRRDVGGVCDPSTERYHSM